MTAYRTKINNNGKVQGNSKHGIGHAKGDK